MLNIITIFSESGYFVNLVRQGVEDRQVLHTCESNVTSAALVPNVACHKYFQASLIMMELRGILRMISTARASPWSSCWDSCSSAPSPLSTSWLVSSSLMSISFRKILSKGYEKKLKTFGCNLHFV